MTQYQALANVPNPFQGVVVQDVWQRLPYDVANIHQSTFDLCLTALDSVSRGRSDSILIYGSPGSGKTHLLSRLQQHLFALGRESPDRVLRCVFVAVRLQSSPTQLWQHVRQRLASDLLRQDEGATQLQRLVAHQIAAERGESPHVWVRNLRVLTNTQDETVSQHLQQVAERLDLGRDLFVVLDHLVQRRLSFDATAWLKGDNLPDLVLEKLGVSRDEGEEREEAARRVVTALCRLAGDTLPIVFCFDQLESLQRYSRDNDAFFRFGRMAADLVDADDNVLTISCLQSAFVEELNSSVREADRDRIFRRRTTLDLLAREQVDLLVRERLDRSSELAPLRAEMRDPLWPIDAAFLDDLFERGPRTPRRVLAGCADRFEQLRTGKAPQPVDLDAFIADDFRSRRRRALEQHRPEDAQQTLLHGLPLLWQTLHPELQPASLEAIERSGADVLLGGERAELPVQVCNERSMNGLAARLRRLVQSSSSGIAGAPPVLMRDARLKISASAKKTREYLKTLEERGFGFVQPSLETLAALESLRSLISDARSGDLSVRGETIAQGTVEKWLAANMDRCLLELARELDAKHRFDPDAESLQDLLEYVLDQHLVPLESAANALDCSSDRVRALAERSPDKFRLLSGPPAVLFAFVPDPALTEPALPELQEVS